MGETLGEMLGAPTPHSTPPQAFFGSFWEDLEVPLLSYKAGLKDLEAPLLSYKAGLKDLEVPLF